MRQFFEFLDAALSPFHAVREAAQRMEQEGFHPLSEMAEWNLLSLIHI